MFLKYKISHSKEEVPSNWLNVKHYSLQRVDSTYMWLDIRWEQIFVMRRLKKEWEVCICTSVIETITAGPESEKKLSFQTWTSVRPDQSASEICPTVTFLSLACGNSFFLVNIVEFLNQVCTTSDRLHRN